MNVRVDLKISFEILRCSLTSLVNAHDKMWKQLAIASLVVSSEFFISAQSILILHIVNHNYNN